MNEPQSQPVPPNPPQALAIVREVVGHPQLRFLNLAEHAAVQQALTVLDGVVNPANAKTESPPPFSVVPKQE